jgi:hypothetical protein
MTQILLKVTLNTITLTLKCSFNHRWIKNIPCADRVVQPKYVIVSSHALITAIVYISSNTETELSNKNAFHNFPFYKEYLSIAIFLILFHFIICISSGYGLTMKWKGTYKAIHR